MYVAPMSARPKRRLPVIAQAAPDTDKQPDWKWALLGVVFFYAILGAELTLTYATLRKTGHPENPDLLAPLIASPVLAVPVAAWGSTRLLGGPAASGPRAIRWMTWCIATSLAAVVMMMSVKRVEFVFTASTLIALTFFGTWLGTRKSARS